MKKYLLLISILALCGCNTDGGSDSSGAGHNYFKPGSTVSVGGRPSGGDANTPDKPSDSTFLRIKSSTVAYTYYNGSYYILGYIDKKMMNYILKLGSPRVQVIILCVQNPAVVTICMKMGNTI